MFLIVGSNLFLMKVELSFFPDQIIIILSWSTMVEFLFLVLEIQFQIQMRTNIYNPILINYKRFVLRITQAYNPICDLTIGGSLVGIGI